MNYVYILKSQKDSSYYVGSTGDIKERFKQHNSGIAKYSGSKAPFILVWYCAFPTKKQALIFEKYLKSGSGFAFRNKHFVIKYHPPTYSLISFQDLTIL